MKTYKSNNIILIIGNGFDLAHGLKTSYNDFANWFITKIEEEVAIYFSTKNDTGFFNKEFLKGFFNRYDFWYFSQKNLIKKPKPAYDASEIKEIISNEFLGKLYDDQYQNWFDIENAYFQELINIKKRVIRSRDNHSNPKRNKKYHLNKLNQLNSELVEIKNYLKEYLETINIKKKVEINTFLKDVFALNRQFIYPFNIFNKYEAYNNLYVVDFNYTETIENYFKNISYKSLKYNYIHGNLKQDNIIFGYGNDQHKEYQEIKELEINAFLENFKTFAYLKNNNYSRIYDEAINGFKDYIVFVLGHSLGATDKTLLEEIFNNEKCKQIHLFKRRDLENDEEKLKKSFDDLVFSASRILTNEKDLRKKILNYKDSEFFP